MLEIAQNIEQTAVRFNPVVLTGTGLLCLVVGLFVWLGGLGFKKLLVAVIGAIAGAVCGFFLFDRNIKYAGLMAAAGVVIAIIFEKIFITILTAALAAALGIAVLAAPYFPNTGEVGCHTVYNTYETENQNEPFSIGLTMEIIKAYIADLGSGTKRACSQMPTYNWVIIATLTAIFIAAGLLFRRLTSALCCAALGTILVFTAMILLLLYKGSVPITYICERKPFFVGVFSAMTTFGTIEQMILCRYAEKKSAVKKQNKDSNQPQEKVSQGWRTT